MFVSLCRRVRCPLSLCLFAPLAVLAVASGCTPVEPPEEDPPGEEVITTVTLTFTPRAPAAGDPLTFTFADPENDGDPVVDDVVLDDDADYDMAIAFVNELSEPAEDITAEVRDEGDEHLVLVFGSGVSGPGATDNDDAVVTHAYADEDDAGLPLGLLNTVTTVAPGTGALSVMLRHMPLETGEAVKDEDVVAEFAAGGEGAIGGSADVNVTFELRVE